ncbi:MAG: AAA family ATPase, partial [Methylobacter sp.]|nr:AAA family ATPase [Methylobacter sp.]
MITNITIKNYKSIIDVPLSLSRVNVFIGENGAGKSNILEAIALVGAASANKLDNEFLASRGVRITQAEYMRPAFPGTNSTESISISVVDSHGESKEFLLSNDNEPYSKWECKVADNAIASLGLNGLI